MKKHRIRLRWLSLIGLAILGVAFLYEKDHVQTQDPVINAMAENASMFDDGSTLTLQSIIPFEWDEVYLVSGSTDAQALEKLIPNAELTQAGTTRMIFLWNGALVQELPLEERPDARYRFDFGDCAPAGSSYLHLTVDTEVAFVKTTLQYGKKTCDLLTLQTDLSEYRQSL